MSWYAIFEFTNPGLFKSKALFERLCDNQEKRSLLGKALSPFILRRTKEEVAKDLPKKTEQILYCEMDKQHSKEYTELCAYYSKKLNEEIETKGMNKSKFLVLEALLRLRQFACHPALLDKNKKGIKAHKVEALFPVLEEIKEEGHKVLIFSQFTQFLSIIKEHMDKSKWPYLYLDGKTRNRQEKIDLFQNKKDHNFFLISLKAGGVGLNLTAAEYVFILDPWWNPAVEAQAIDRTHRIGQTKSVFSYKLITKGTVEEKILKLQEEKKDLFKEVLGKENMILKSLTEKDISFLFS